MADFKNKIVYQIYPKSFRTRTGTELEICAESWKSWIICRNWA